MAGIVHGGGLTAAIARYGGAREDWLDLSTGINPDMPDLPVIPAEVWNRLPDRGLVDAARVAARDWYLGDMPAVELPPSVLPDISPTRGENGQGRDPCHMQTTAAGDANEARGDAAPHPLAPLVGEMSGRTEGGEPTFEVGAVEKTRTSNLPLPIPGTQSLIQILPRLVPHDRPVAVVSPTYGEYAHCFQAAGLTVDPIPSIEALRPEHGALVVVNPNNPTGRIYSPEALLAVHDRLLARGGHLHVDEAFGDGRPELTVAWQASRRPGLTVSRSFGKFFGMAGIRLGFVFARPETRDAIEAALGPWAVSGPALYVAAALMRRDRSPIFARILARKAALETVLTGARLSIAGGTELFALVAHPRAQSLFEHLSRSHILVRKFDYAPDWLRIGLAPDEQGDRKLAGALASFQM